MPRLYARCPNTHALIDTKIKSDLDTLSKLAEQKVAVLCDRCGNVHTVRIADLFSNHEGENGR